MTIKLKRFNYKYFVNKCKDKIQYVKNRIETQEREADQVHTEDEIKDGSILWQTQTETQEGK
jgi:hypothetical protein